MRIVFLNVTGSLGGAERVLLTLLRELRRLRPNWRLTVLAGGAGPLLAAVGELGCEARVLPLGEALDALGDWGNASRTGLLVRMLHALPAVFRYRASLRCELQAMAPAIVQSNGFKMHVLGAMACPDATKLVWHIHDFVSNRSAMKGLLRWFAKKPAAMVAISAAVGEDLKTMCEARTIWNSVDLDRFAPGDESQRAEIRIGLVATFARWKGHEVFLRALALLPSDIAWRGFIAGGGVYQRSGSQWTEPELRALVIELGLEERVEFTRFLPDPAPFLRTLDIAVHASTEPEPFGLVIAEAMAAGRAVVTTSASIVTDGVDGLVCRRRDVDGMARAMERLARDPELRCRLGKAAIVSARKRFRPERMAAEFIELYESLA